MARSPKTKAKVVKKVAKKPISKNKKVSGKAKLPVSYEDVCAAAKRLAGVANRTPVMTSRTLNRKTGAKIFLKCENY